VLNADPLELTYQVSGEWGTSVVSGPTVTAIPAVGASAEVAEDLQLTPTTLRLTGVISNSQGTPIQWAYVSISGASLIGSGGSGGENRSNATYTVYTDENGAYELYVVVKGGVVTDTLDYAVWYNGTNVTLSGPEQTFAVDQLNPIAQDFTLEVSGGEFVARRQGLAMGMR